MKVGRAGDDARVVAEQEAPERRDGGDAPDVAGHVVAAAVLGLARTAAGRCDLGSSRISSSSSGVLGLLVDKESSVAAAFNRETSLAL